MSTIVPNPVLTYPPFCVAYRSVKEKGPFWFSCSIICFRRFFPLKTPIPYVDVYFSHFYFKFIYTYVFEYMHYVTVSPDRAGEGPIFFFGLEKGRFFFSGWGRPDRAGEGRRGRRAGTRTFENDNTSLSMLYTQTDIIINKDIIYPSLGHTGEPSIIPVQKDFCRLRYRF